MIMKYFCGKCPVHIAMFTNASPKFSGDPPGCKEKKRKKEKRSVIIFQTYTWGIFPQSMLSKITFITKHISQWYPKITTTCASLYSTYYPSEINYTVHAHHYLSSDGQENQIIQGNVKYQHVQFHPPRHVDSS